MNWLPVSWKPAVGGSSPSAPTISALTPARGAPGEARGRNLAWRTKNYFFFLPFFFLSFLSFFLSLFFLLDFLPIVAPFLSSDVIPNVAKCSSRTKGT